MQGDYGHLNRVSCRSDPRRERAWFKTDPDRFDLIEAPSPTGVKRPQAEPPKVGSLKKVQPHVIEAREREQAHARNNRGKASPTQVVAGRPAAAPKEVLQSKTAPKQRNQSEGSLGNPTTAAWVPQHQGSVSGAPIDSHRRVSSAYD
jgi:hypothetical protein